MNKYVLILKTLAQMSNENIWPIRGEAGYECLVSRNAATSLSREAAQECSPRRAVGYGGQTASPNGAKKCFFAQTDGPAQAGVTRGTERPLQKFRRRRAGLVRLLRGFSRERNNGDEPKAHIRG